MKYVSVTLSLAIVLTVANSPATGAEPNKTTAETLGQRLFQGMDKNADGTIAGNGATGAVRTHFDRIDADSDGQITPKELHEAIVARAKRERESPLAEKPSRPSDFRRPQAKHRTSRLVPTPWLGYGHDDSPEVRGATYLKSPEEIRAIFDRLKKKPKGSLSYPKGSGLRIVATGHSWMWPGFATLPKIATAAGLEQQLRVNGRGGEPGAARMMWELENGILSSGRAMPVCMAAITTGEWDIMMWGAYTNDRPEYYFAWIDFCLKYNPKMEFYRFNGWPQWADGFGHGEKEPRIENYRARAELNNEAAAKLIAEIDKRYPNKVHILPTNEAMMAALELYFQGNLSGVKGLTRKVDGKTPSIWSDGGHLGDGMAWLEGYVFYATIYKRSPELIKGKPKQKFVNDEMDAVFRKIAWQAVINNPLSDVTDKNGNGIGDEIE